MTVIIKSMQQLLVPLCEYWKETSSKTTKAKRRFDYVLMKYYKELQHDSNF